MAASLRGSVSPEGIKANSSRRRHHGGRTDSRTRWSPNGRGSPQRQPPRPLPEFILAASNSSHSSSSLIPLDQVQGITMERTPSGNSIMSDTPFPQRHTNTLIYRSPDALSDSEAADRVISHFGRLPSHHKHERILRKLIKRDDPQDNSDLDDKALAGILTTADSVFFAGTLSGRVKWEWSDQTRYHTELIGTTALRPCKDREGFETLIVLSSPILRSGVYDRRLLLSAFLHELVHCYLFVSCGWDARMQGGHTWGFHRIAALIDGWVGEGYLSLCSMKANLEYFRKREGADAGLKDRETEGRWHAHEGCSQSPRPPNHVFGLPLPLQMPMTLPSLPMSFQARGTCCAPDYF